MTIFMLIVFDLHCMHYYDCMKKLYEFPTAFWQVKWIYENCMKQPPAHACELGTGLKIQMACVRIQVLAIRRWFRQTKFIVQAVCLYPLRLVLFCYGQVWPFESFDWLFICSIAWTVSLTACIFSWRSVALFSCFQDQSCSLVTTFMSVYIFFSEVENSGEEANHHPKTTPLFFIVEV